MASGFSEFRAFKVFRVKGFRVESLGLSVFRVWSLGLRVFRGRPSV